VLSTKKRPVVLTELTLLCSAKQCGFKVALEKFADNQAAGQAKQKPVSKLIHGLA